MSRKSLWLALAIVAVAGAYIWFQPTVNAQKQKKLQYASGPPKLALSVEPTVIKTCETANVKLLANATSPDNAALSYHWTVTGGKVTDNGPSPTWDLTGLPPGAYKANVEVGDSIDPNCVSFSSIPIVIIDCPPVCPTVSISCPEAVQENSTATFTTHLTGGTSGITPTYNWTVSTGRIISGQGTESITDDTTGLAGQTLRASVDIGGFGVPCPATCSVAIPIVIKPTQFDVYYDIARNDEKARLDNYAIQLQQEPGSQGYVIVYPSRKATDAQVHARAQRIVDYLVNTRGVDEHRVTVQMGPARDSWVFELWVVPEGAQPPIPQK